MHLGNRLPLAIALLFLTLPRLLLAEAPPASSGVLLELKNEHVEALILPAAAGRIVSFKRPGGQNILKEQPQLWNDTTAQLGQPETWNGEPKVDGQVHWNGPQADFWNDQRVRPDHAGRMWPPDPWTEIVPYQVVTRTNTMLALKGPESPVTGLGMTKTYVLKENGELMITVEAKNTRGSWVEWDLWSVTRVDPAYPVFTLVHGGYAPQLLEGDYSGTQAPLPWRMGKGGLFGFLQETPLPEGVKSRNRKALLMPPQPDARIAYIRGRDLFVTSFRPAPPKDAAPGHAPIELYLEQKAGGDGVLELEFHGIYRKLPPGDSIQVSETWTLKEIEGPAETRADWERIAREALLE